MRSALTRELTAGFSGSRRPGRTLLGRWTVGVLGLEYLDFQVSRHAARRGDEVVFDLIVLHGTRAFGGQRNHRNPGARVEVTDLAVRREERVLPPLESQIISGLAAHRGDTQAVLRPDGGRIGHVSGS